MNQKILYSALCAASVLLIFISCEPVYDPVNVRGAVLDSDTSSPVSEATVSITSPEDLAAETFSNESGEFLFEEVAIDSVINITIRVQKEGFSTETITLLAAPEHELIVPDIKIRNLQQPGDGNGSGNGNGTGGGAAAIQLENIGSLTLNISETGGGATSAFTFVVLDSTDTPISPENAVDVEFRITEGPRGGESIYPEIVRTDENGMVTSSIFAGKAAGNMKIEAKIERPEHGIIIRSAPIALTIHGGFPSPDHFSIAVNESSPVNVPGYRMGDRVPINVLLGDKYSNPVKPETPVYFNTTGGVIQGSGVTNEDGEVEVDLITGNPQPSGGFAVVSAFTFDENEKELYAQTIVLFSGPPNGSFIDLSPSTFTFSPEQSRNYTLTVTDANENPLPAGTTISIEPSDNVEVNRDSFTVPSTLEGGRNRTIFNFTATASEDFSGTASFEITVSAPGLTDYDLTFPD
jgi:hypothetical protein